jgi:hypothetical protein
MYDERPKMVDGKNPERCSTLRCWCIGKMKNGGMAKSGYMGGGMAKKGTKTAARLATWMVVV